MNETENKVFLQILSVDTTPSQILEAEMKWHVTQNMEQNKTHLFDLQLARKKLVNE